MIGLVLLGVQIALGGWTSANYAALACGTDFPTCVGQWWPPHDFREGFVLWRGIGVDYEGGVLDGQARIAIQMAHRMMALLVTGHLLMLAIRLLRTPGLRGWGSLLGMVLLAQVGLGIANVVLSLPLQVAVAAQRRRDRAAVRAGVACWLACAHPTHEPGRALAGTAILGADQAAGGGVDRVHRDHRHVPGDRARRRLAVARRAGSAVSASGWRRRRAAAINHLLDQRIDKVMARTAAPPAGDRHAAPDAGAGLRAWCWASASMAILLLLVNAITALLTFASLIGYAIVYTGFLKRATPQNIVIGGIAGAAPPLLGWAAVTGMQNPRDWAYALLLVLIIFVWTPPHFWALAIFRRDDYARALVPMLPVTHGVEYTRWQILLYTVLLVVVTVLPWADAHERACSTSAARWCWARCSSGTRGSCWIRRTNSSRCACSSTPSST